MFAKVILNNKAKQLDRTFDYLIPEHLEEYLKIGSRVLVNFRGRKEDGYVIDYVYESEFECKEIIDIISNEEIPEEKIELAKIMSRRYFCNLSECIKLMVNPELNTKNIDNLIKPKKVKVIKLSTSTISILKDIIILDYINNGDSDSYNNDISDIYTKIYIELNIKNNKQQEILKYIISDIINNVINNVTNNRINDTISNTTNILDEEIEKHLKELEIEIKTLTDLNFSVSSLNTLVKNNVFVKTEKIVEFEEFNFYKTYQREEKLVLNEEQQNVYNSILEDIENERYNTHLIYGVTGSGKTEIYLQLIQETINKGKSAIVLVPEISLTPQMLERFNRRFGQNISILHSRLGNRRRFEEWNRIKEQNVQIVIGARSAIFAPCKNLGIIIIDEEHDSSYKSGSSPKYNAKEIATFLAKNSNIPLVLGSATPLIDTYYYAKSGKYILHTLKKRASNMLLPKVEIVDIRKQEGILSERLKNAIAKNLKNKEQTIIFLNRRGYSFKSLCTSCGEVIKCKRCNIALTYHKEDDTLKCHYCGYTKKNQTICDNCGSIIKNIGIGTQKLQEMIQKEFPNATTIRMDLDTIKTKLSHEEILEKFKNENIDILIGTQMITKGHHFPNVTLSVVVLADTMLNFDSYRSSETAFQNIVQVLGRSGREKEGIALIQTYTPEDYVLNMAQNAEYEAFYEMEIGIRKALNYPPFSDIIQVRVESFYEERAENYAKKIQKILENIKIKELEKFNNMLEKEEIYNNYTKRNVIQKNIESLKTLKIYEATPFKIDKIQNMYRWKVLIKCNMTNYIAKLISFVVKNISKNKDPKISVDFNPLNI